MALIESEIYVINRALSVFPLFDSLCLRKEQQVNDKMETENVNTKCQLVAKLLLNTAWCLKDGALHSENCSSASKEGSVIY